MDIDEGPLANTPPLFNKSKKLVPVISKSSPNKLSELLSVFGARKSLSSVSRMDRNSSGRHHLRTYTAAVSYAESPSSSVESTISTFEGVEEGTSIDNEDVASDESEDELNGGDTIHVLPRSTLAAKPAVLPARARRSGIVYKRPILKRTKKQKFGKKSAGNIKRLLASDTKSMSERDLTSARFLVRQDIAAHTKPKRDAFLLANKEYFLPLLPAHNYINKLDHAHVGEGDDSQDSLYVDLEEQPKGVTATMKPYQLEGLSFLVHMHDNGMSAILGDEMGLGKTLQTLSLFQHLVENKPTTGELRPNLVVCPLSVLSSWISETRRWVPGLNVVRFHGPKSERERFKKECLEKKTRYEGAGGKHVGRSAAGGVPQSANPDDRMDLFVTTYETFAAEQNWFKRSFVWRYCVLDEGHKIKNDKSDIASALQGLSAEYRLLLTGTPLQNNLKEMWALLHWLLPEVFTAETGDAFRKAFDLTKGKVSTSFMDDARSLLELLMLRRMKSCPSVNLGLPPKEEVLLYVPLTPYQRFWYTRLLTRADNATLEALFTGTKEKESDLLKQEHRDPQLALLANASKAIDNAEDVDTTEVWAESRDMMQQAIKSNEQDENGGAWKKLMNLVMQLRKVCNHPYTIKDAAPPDYWIGEHVKHASGKFVVLDKLVQELVVKQGKKILIFSGFTHTLDLCQELFALKDANTRDGPFSYSRLDGRTTRARRNLSIRLFNDMKSDCKVMLLSTRAGGLGINLTSATDVVFMDEDWNPQVTLQAEARAHRIGQTKKVTIYKMCTQGTVEEQMMGRIRKKLYLSAKITESMRNIHTAAGIPSRKRKREFTGLSGESEAPHLDTASLQSLLRRGAQTLTRPQIEINDLLAWDWRTTLEKCKDQPMGDVVSGGAAENMDEEDWLNSMEKVETAVFEGKKHHMAVEKKLTETTALNRADRRIGKNTTVEIDGYMIAKESLGCAEWEAVPTLAGKDSSLVEYKKEKRPPIVNQDICQTCWDGGKLILCSGCPRSYHTGCFGKDFQAMAKGNFNFNCPQHECRDCQAKTTDAGGMIYRCRWCENGYCEDCLDFENTVLVGDTLPEFEVLGYGRVSQAYYIECPQCIEHWKVDAGDKQLVENEKARIRERYAQHLETLELETLETAEAGAEQTPDTLSEVATPVFEEPLAKPRGHSHSAKKTSVRRMESYFDCDEVVISSGDEKLPVAHPLPRSAKKQRIAMF